MLSLDSTTQARAEEGQASGPWGQVLYCNFVAHLGYAAKPALKAGMLFLRARPKIWQQTTTCRPEGGHHEQSPGMVLPEDVGLNASRQGLFVLAQSGDSVEIRNDARFAPKVW